MGFKGLPFRNYRHPLTITTPLRVHSNPKEALPSTLIALIQLFLCAVDVVLTTFSLFCFISFGWMLCKEKASLAFFLFLTKDVQSYIPQIFFIIMLDCFAIPLLKKQTCHIEISAVLVWSKPVGILLIIQKQ